MFFPSVLINFYLALTPISKSKFVFIQLMYASIVSYPQALFDYYGFLDKKFKMIDGQVRIIYTHHSDLVMKALENRMDLFKLTFVVFQLLSLIFLSVRIFVYNNALHVTFVKNVKDRLIQTNKAKGVHLIQTKVDKPDFMSTFSVLESEEPYDENGSMTREQIKLCIKKLDRIAKEKG